MSKLIYVSRSLLMLNPLWHGYMMPRLLFWVQGPKHWIVVRRGDFQFESSPLPSDEIRIGVDRWAIRHLPGCVAGAQ